MARDELVGPPRHLQGISELDWSRSHLCLRSINSLVSAGGRLFSIKDRASAEHPALPGRFALICRDAFNGIELWRHPFPDWEPIDIYIKYTPTQLQRRLVALVDKVYCTPGLDAPISTLHGMGRGRKEAVVQEGEGLPQVGPEEFVEHLTQWLETSHALSQAGQFGQSGFGAVASVKEAKIVVLGLIGSIPLLGNILLVANWLVERGVVDWARNIRSEYLTGTALTITTVLLILLGSPRAGAHGWIRRCPACDHVLVGRGRYCGECGSKV